jgi:hypothetical protein
VSNIDTSALQIPNSTPVLEGGDSETTQSQSRVHDGALRLNHATGTIESAGVTKMNMGSDRSEANGILATARSSGGSRSAPIARDSSVIVGGMEMSVGAATTLGYLRQTASGDYVETGMAAQGQPSVSPSESAQEAPSVPDVPLLPATEQAIDAVTASLPAGLAQSLIHRIATKGVDALDVDFPTTSSMGREEFTEAVRHIEASFIAQAAHVLDKQGIDPASFVAWCEARYPGELRDAKLRHAHTRSTLHYQPLVQRYLANTRPADDDLTARGLNVRTNRQGVTEVAVPGMGWVDVRAAKRAGLID